MEIFGRITDVQRQKKLKNRVSVYVNGEYLGSVEDIVWVRAGLKAGDDLPVGLWEDMRVRQEQQAALDRALTYLGVRARSSAEMERYLAGKGFSPEAVAIALEKLTGYGYIDDGEYAAMLVRDRVSLKGAGKRAIEGELKRLGIAPEDAGQALEQYSPQDEQEAAERQAAKALRGIRDEDPRKRKAKLYANLARRGYSPDVIGRAMNAALGSRETDDE